MSQASALVLRDDVTLRRVTVSDAPAMYRWMLDPAVAGNIGLRSTPSLEKTRAWIERATTEESFAARAILLSGRHVGNVVLDRIDKQLETARLSIYVGESDHRSHGIGLTATCLMLKEAFGILHLNKVSLTVHCRNVAALKTYIRLGFVVEGVLRDEFMFNAERLNLFYMGLFAREFAARLRVEQPE